MSLKWLCGLTALLCAVYAVEPDLKIVNGEDVDPSEYPFMVRIQSMFGDHMCGGSLYRQDIVLTAAHCVVFDGQVAPTYFFDVVIGDHSAEEDGTEQVRKISRIIVHEEYDLHVTGIPTNDIAILVLEESAELINGVVETVTIQKNPSYYAGGTDIKVIGWGITDAADAESIAYSLQELSYSITDMEECKAYWQSTADDGSAIYQEDLLFDVILEGQLCARDQANELGKFSSGDSGGPLFVYDESQGVNTQIGIVSWGIADPALLGYDMFMDLRSYVDWIENNADKAEQEEEWLELYPGFNHGVVHVVNKNGHRSTICSDMSAMGSMEAHAVCNEFGFDNGVLTSSINYLPKKDNDGIPPYGMTNLACENNNWDECERTPYDPQNVKVPCFHGDQMAVRCFNDAWQFNINVMYPQLIVKKGFLRGKVVCDLVARRSGVDLNMKSDIVMGLVVANEGGVEFLEPMKYKKRFGIFVGKVKKDAEIENGSCLGCMAHIPGTHLYTAMMPEGCEQNAEHFEQLLDRLNAEETDMNDTETNGES